MQAQFLSALLYMRQEAGKSNKKSAIPLVLVRLILSVRPPARRKAVPAARGKAREKEWRGGNRVCEFWVWGRSKGRARAKIGDNKMAEAGAEKEGEGAAKRPPLYPVRFVWDHGGDDVSLVLAAAAAASEVRTVPLRRQPEGHHEELVALNLGRYEYRLDIILN